MNATKPRAILHIDMDTFFCSVERLLDPALEGRPVIVGGDPSQRGVVAACSYEARAFGVHSAMPLARAGRLCPQAVYLRGDFQAYLYYSRRVRDILCEYTPTIEPAGIDEAYLDLTGCRLAFGEPAVVVREIRARIAAELGLPASAGLSTSKVVSKVGSKVAKPNGFVEVPPGGEAGFLAPLPVEKLPGVGPVCSTTLTDLGIRTVGDLALLPPEALESVLGSWGRVLSEHARGEDRRRLEPGRAPKSVSRETTFDNDTIDYELVRCTLLLLAEKCCRALRADGLATTRIAVKLRHSDFRTYMKFRTLKVPTDQEQTVFAAAGELFEGLLERGVRIRLVGVALSGLVGAGCQGELFEGPAAGRSLKLDSLNESIDRIRERFGFSSILRGSTSELLPDRRSSLRDTIPGRLHEAASEGSAAGGGGAAVRVPQPATRSGRPPRGC
ncbi:MAG: DNA polymerase IV [Actinobacteria bacterium]|nr:DNA polymerase IV [Actinomycetota bacterium]MBU2688846.1 DNA polymerase IV [Actinomycetota bacterium]